MKANTRVRRMLDHFLSAGPGAGMLSAGIGYIPGEKA